RREISPRARASAHRAYDGVVFVALGVRPPPRIHGRHVGGRAGCRRGDGAVADRWGRSGAANAPASELSRTPAADGIAGVELEPGAGAGAAGAVGANSRAAGFVGGDVRPIATGCDVAGRS